VAERFLPAGWLINFGFALAPVFTGEAVFLG
jgi:hypothetical protein